MKHVFYYKDDGYIELKDYKPKYQYIEFILDCGKYMKPLRGIVKFKELIKKYGNNQVLSVADYDETKTTSIIVKENKANEI